MKNVICTDNEEINRILGYMKLLGMSVTDDTIRRLATDLEYRAEITTEIENQRKYILSMLFDCC